MPAFIVATVRITDPDQFQHYSGAIKGVSAEHGGEAVVAGAVSEVLEGASPVGERVVVVRFPDAASARAYIADPRYQKGKALRQGAAELEMRLLEV